MRSEGRYASLFWVHFLFAPYSGVILWYSSKHGKHIMSLSPIEQPACKRPPDFQLQVSCANLYQVHLMLAALWQFPGAAAWLGEHERLTLHTQLRAQQ